MIYEPDEPIPDTELSPGRTCPLPDCDHDIVTWYARKGRRDDVADDECAIDVRAVEPTGITSGFAGDYIIVDHEGPTMDTQETQIDVND
jgi:hypothetical protein